MEKKKEHVLVEAVLTAVLGVAVSVVLGIPLEYVVIGLVAFVITVIFFDRSS